MNVHVTFNGTRDELREFLRRFLNFNRNRRTANKLAMHIGVAALGSIFRDFLIKSAGGAGEVGGTWPRLSPEYLAYKRSRKKRGEMRKAGFRYGAASGTTGLLTKEQSRTWKDIFRSMMKDSKGNKRLSAQVAWRVLKQQGAKTLIDTYGDSKEPILIDTAKLGNSLRPGTIDGDRYTKPRGLGGRLQIFKVFRKGVRIGTSRPYAETHQYGTATIPRRQFLPNSAQEIPASWSQEWTEVGAEVLAADLVNELRKREAGPRRLSTDVPNEL